MLKIIRTLFTFALLLIPIGLSSATPSSTYKGFNIEKELEKPTRAFKKAVKKGAKAEEVEAYYLMGRMVEGYYLFSSGYQEEDSMRWYLIAAKLGYAPAQFQYANGAFELFGEFEKYKFESDKDIIESLELTKLEAMTWAHMAGIQGNREAEFFLYEQYKNGGVVPINLQTAFDWLKKSAENGYPEAMYEYGKNLLSGYQLAPKDEDVGLGFIRKAAESEHPEALKKMGGYYATGIYVEQDKEKAIEYFYECVYLEVFLCAGDLSDQLYEGKEYKKAYAWDFIETHFFNDKKELDEITGFISYNDFNKDIISDEEKAEAIDIAKACLISNYEICELFDKF